MPGRCPVCGQSLPQAISYDKLQMRLRKLSLPALAAERNRLKNEFEAHREADLEIATKRAQRLLATQLRAIRERSQRAKQQKDREMKRLREVYSARLVKESENARLKAESKNRKELLDAKRRAKDAEDRRHKEAQRTRKEMASRVERESEARMEKFREEREKEKLRDEREKERLKGDLDDLRRKLEKQTGEQLGSEAELDLFTELRSIFCPNDKIERIGRGVKGADIIHEVMDAGKLAGRIVYESKNTSAWNKGFISQAKKYQTQYETPHVMVVTRVFPPKHKGLCVMKGIPVIERCVAIHLATIIREGVVEIAKLRLSGKSREGKSDELFEYIISDRFATRFREISDGIRTLRDQQQKERTWHENGWETESKIHNQIEGSQRKVEAQIRAIVSQNSEDNQRKSPVNLPGLGAASDSRQKVERLAHGASAR